MNMSVVSTNKCHICDSSDLFEFNSYPSLGRVTSDCKPWPQGGNLGICQSCSTVQKIINDQWRTEIQKIYSEYELFHQAKGKNEQPVFNCHTGKSAPRSSVIMDFVQDNVKISEAPKIIDIGCGVGNTLKALGGIFRSSKLFGFEPYAKNIDELRAIPNVLDIYTNLEQFSGSQFELVTMVHVLEHIESPNQILKDLKSIVGPSGHLVIAVPDYHENPFDLVIADHASHFSVSTLRRLLECNGWEIINISNTFINKEIIAICRSSSETKITPFETNFDKTFVELRLDWMKRLVTSAVNISGEAKPFGIFGTSIAANWIYGILRDKVAYFVDEDHDRTDRLHYEKPVYHSNNIPPDSHTLICLQPNVVDKIISRLNSTRFKLYATPDF